VRYDDAPNLAAKPGRPARREEMSAMNNRFKGTSSNRRMLLQRGAIAGGIAVAAGGLRGAPVLAQAADSRLKTVLDRGKLVVGTGSTNPPWHYEDQNGQLIGMDIDMAKLLARGLFDLTDDQLANRDEWSKRVDLVVQAADARIPNLASDKIDIVCQFMTVTPARAREVEFTIPYYREAVTLLLPKNSPYNSTKDFAGKKARIAILQNPTATAMVHNGVPDADVQVFDSVANSVLALDSGRVDATAIDLSTAQFKAKQAPDKYKVATDSWQPQTYAFAVKPGDQRWLNWVNACLHEYLVGLDFQYYQAAFKENFGVELPPPPAGFPVEFK
jgi:polar amino acid transport system substrate-binding protein